ncbi:ROK family protein [Nakamurella leprariae]|uniref:ROK family protein n=1 Tax=Nakamurella leprariae TaxID=2803911 RepID=A0A938YGT3_9ACTN|nr:ROK family protein [Nakamurella leprariae]MBM9467849.1 ROK family protein [Nakamurella leprariae]
MPTAVPTATPSGAVLGVDVGATNLRIGLVDPSGAEIAPISVPLPVAPHARLAAIVAAVATSAAELGPRAIGIAIAGTVTDGTITWSANLGLHDVPLRDLITAATGRPTEVLNDARAAGLAEAAAGPDGGAGTVLAVTVGTGIGGALIVDGRLRQGTGDAGEIGHMVVEPGGVPCGCGRRGCWERYAGGDALRLRAMQLLGPEPPDPLAELITLIEAGDLAAGAVLDEASERFRSGIDDLCAVLAPDVVVLGGGIMARRGLVARRYHESLTGLRWAARTRFELSRLGDAAGLLGAARHAADALLLAG